MASHRVPFIARNWPLAVLIPLIIFYATERQFIIAAVCAYLFSSIVTFFLYRCDKLSAQKDDWRIPERYLHIWEFLCGWPGAILGQNIYRHKTRKTSFRVVFYLSMLANIIAALALIWYYY